MSRQERAGRFHGLLERLRRRAGADSSPETPADAEVEFPRIGEVTGNTVFGDRPSRLRNLTGEHVSGSLTDPAFQGSVFKIRLAGSRSSSQQAGQLVERRYAWRGYQIPTGVAPTDPNLRTFVAHREGVPVGTVSVRIDSPKGLSADELYKAELDEMRSADARLCEFTRLAVEDEVVHKNVLGGLFHTAYLFSHEVRNCDYGVIEVNPRHAVFYRRTIFFELIGPERLNRRVNAPSVLLCVSFEKVKAEFKKYFDAPTRPPGRLMFAHWFPPDEATGVLGRLHKLES